MTRNQPYAQEGYDLMGAAFEVHRETGGGLAEEIYQECLGTPSGARGTIDQLHANQSQASRIPDQLRAARGSRMETIRLDGLD